MSKTVKHPLTDKLINCGHCGRESLMFVICNGTYEHMYEWGKGEDGEDIYIHHEDTYNVLVCPACHAATVVLEERNSENEYDIPDASGGFRTVHRVHKTTLYPARTRAFQYTPTDVVQSYETAVKLLHAEPLACAVFVGRTLEFLCKDRNASGKTLDQMLKDLANKGEIPQSILDMALSLKGFRNLAAHATPVKISREDAALLLKICEVIIEYTYEAAQMLDALKKRLEETKSQ